MGLDLSMTRLVTGKVAVPADVALLAQSLHYLAATNITLGATETKMIFFFKKNSSLVHRFHKSFEEWMSVLRC